MKILVGALVGLLVFCLFIFWIDPMIVNWIVTTIQPEPSWAGLAKVITWCVVLFFSIGLTLFISIAFATLVIALLSI